MNDTGGGVTAIHDVPGDITRIGFHWMLFFPFCHSKGVLLFCLHTECLGDHGGASCHEFANFVFTRRIAEVTDFLCPEFFPCPEFSNYRIVSSHGVSRMVVGLALHANGGLFVVVYRPIRGVCV